MDGDAKIRACAPPEHFEPAADRAARIIACAPPPRTGTLARLLSCIVEARSHNDDMEKASPAPAIAALDAALEAMRRRPAPLLPATIPSPPMTPPAPAARDGGKVLQKSETLPLGRVHSQPNSTRFAGRSSKSRPGPDLHPVPAAPATSGVDRSVVADGNVERFSIPAKAAPPARALMTPADWDDFHHLRHLRPAEPRARPLDHGVRTFWDFRDRIIADIRAGRVSPTAATVVDYAAKKYNLTLADASEWIERVWRAIDAEIRKLRGPKG